MQLNAGFAGQARRLLGVDDAPFARRAEGPPQLHEDVDRKVREDAGLVIARTRLRQNARRQDELTDK